MITQGSTADCFHLNWSLRKKLTNCLSINIFNNRPQTDHFS